MRRGKDGTRTIYMREGVVDCSVVDMGRRDGGPLKILNGADRRALGSYKGGRILFLGLGTGLGSAMIVDGMLQPMELAHLSYKNGKTYEDYLGARGLQRL